MSVFCYLNHFEKTHGASSTKYGFVLLAKKRPSLANSLALCTNCAHGTNYKLVLV